MKRVYPLHPFLFAVFPVFSLFAANINETFISEIFIPVGITLLLAGFLLFIFSILFRSIHKAAIFSSLVLIFLSSYVHVCIFIYSLSPSVGGSFCQKGGFYMLWLSILFIVAFLLWRTKKDFLPFTKTLYWLGVLLVLIPLGNVAWFQVTQGLYLFPSFQAYATNVSWLIQNDQEVVSLHKKELQTNPDIYYFIFDRYGRADVLKDFYNFDNTEFLSSLEEKGFYVARESTANYPQSAHSLASSLNLQHLEGLSEEMGQHSYDWKPLYVALQDNKVQRFLKSQGYVYIHSGSWWQPTLENRNADVNINLYALPEFSSELFRNTAFYPIAWSLGMYNRDYWHWERVLYKFERLAEIPKIKEPTFVFAHFNVPHPPFVFDENGNYVRGARRIRGEESLEYYAEQLAFTNRKIVELVDTLIADSEVPPIIIIQGDEGPYFLRLRGSISRFDWSSITDQEIREKMGILNAYYFPGVDTSVLYPSITPVNSFRLLFNLYFGTDFELLPDDAYIFAETEHQLYKFFLVNDKVQKL